MLGFMFASCYLIGVGMGRGATVYDVQRSFFQILFTLIVLGDLLKFRFVFRCFTSFHQFSPSWHFFTCHSAPCSSVLLGVCCCQVTTSIIIIHFLLLANKTDNCIMKYNFPLLFMSSPNAWGRRSRVVPSSDIQ